MVCLYFSGGGGRITTVTDIEAIVIARQALLVQVGRKGHERGFSEGRSEIGTAQGQGVNN